VDYFIPEEVLAHRGDTKWLEVHGEEAMERFVTEHQHSLSPNLRSLFAREMFSDPKTGGIYARAPKWWKRRLEQWQKELRRSLSAIMPELKDAWKSHPWDNLDPSPPTRDDLDPSGPAPVVTVEARGKSR
jgi:hypothetical protein